MMKIIIDIPKKVYDQICDQNLDGIMATAIRCGKPLLKDTLPSAQPERKKGRWIEMNDELITGTCSVCGWNAIFAETDVAGMPFCPFCGAKMMEGEER